MWTQSLVANLSGLGFEGEFHLVNPRGGEMLGRPVHRSLLEVPGDPMAMRAGQRDRSPPERARAPLAVARAGSPCERVVSSQNPSCRKPVKTM